MGQPTLTYRGTVYPWHCDHMGHMNVMWYVGKFDEASWQLFTQLGLTPAYLRRHGRGMAAVEQRIRYLRELRAGDPVTVHTQMLEVKDKVLRFVHEMRDESTGEIAATSELTAVHFDTAMRRATVLGGEIRGQAEALLGS